MTSSPSVTFADPDGWRLGRPDGEGATVSEAVIAPPDAPADVLAAALRAGGYVGRAIVLALPAEVCLCARIATGDLPARHRGQAMLYRLEERLPVSAEDVLADFIPAGPASALGVCVQRRTAQTLLATLAKAGVTKIAAICPRSLLALQHYLEAGNAAERPVPDGLAEMVLWADGLQLEVFLLGSGDGALLSWAVMPHDAHDLALHLDMQSLAGDRDGGTRPARVTACGVSPAVLDRLRQSFAGAVEAPPVSTRTLAASAAGAVLARRLLPRVDFGQSSAAGGGSGSRRAFAQARGPLAWVASSAAVLALSVLVALFWRAARYNQLAAEYETRQQDVFRRAFPGQAVPRDVASRLASEEQRLRAGGAGAAGAGADPGRGRMSAADGLLVLRDVIAALPADLRFTVSELRIDGAGGDRRDGGRFTLSGDARSVADAQAIADALRGGFEVEPPRTELRPGGEAIGFTITGGVTRTRAAAVAPATVSAAAAAAHPDVAGGDR